jgi:hypothetical protein
MLAILAAVMLAAAPPNDTVFTADGGRLVGTVVEEGPQGVAVRLADGTFRRLARREVVRIEYADGSVSTPSQGAPPAAPSPPTYAPPPQAYPPPQYPPPPPPAYPPPPYRGPPPRPAWQEAPGGGPLSPLYLTFGLGGAFFNGEAERDVDIDRVLGSQFALSFEGGVRLNPHLAIGIYADGGVGDAGTDVCDPLIDCTAGTGRIGVLLRATFQPSDPVTPWVSIGTGYESSTVSVEGGSSDDLTYSGWEIARLQGGVDFRSGRVIGVGLYAGARLGRFSKVEDSTAHVRLGPDRELHTTVEGGVRFTLFP